MNTPQSFVDVLIVGAGPTGLTLACDLARRNVDHRIIERSTSYNIASRAKGIQPRSLEVVDDLKAVRYIMDTGVVDLPVRYYNEDGRSIVKPSITVAASAELGSPYPDPVWIAQFDVEKALRDRYEMFGGKVELDREAVGLVQDLEGVLVTVNTSEGKEQIHARYVVGADGGKSSVRKFIHHPLVGNTHDHERWYLGDVRLEGLDRDHIHIWTSPEGMVGVTPLPKSDIWQLQATIPSEIKEPEKPSLEVYQDMFNRRAGAGHVQFIDASWLSIYRINVRMVESYRNGRVFLAGDAAHVHSPAGGQGMNTGIQDAYNLGWKLESVIRGANTTLLDTYNEERRPVAKAVLEDSTKKMGAILGTATERGALSQSLSTVSDDLTSGLLISYRSSSLTLPSHQANVTRSMPGDRAPNAKGLQSAEFTGDVFDLLRGPHWTLFAFVNRTDHLSLMDFTFDELHTHCIVPSHVEGEECIIDAAGNAYKMYDITSETLLLIRPDGYIALRTSIEDSAQILQYLNSMYHAN
ncbi:2-polyprenyl-6-methoxyphenol hydroxylase [Paenibacillus polysaccharolyticus]|uniref:2-polyprenyl-6-methoxyphenol hydroxylase n=1 Tax=Paenibacillus polysaccharolyticus TaxID=582692 RepID=A0A1G5D061_9BACL|nr:FAD-dependent monooxygenase [Paenibacillus polysaccharolyticus]SCY08229.1 2-polyprenyl-6-methoxyphenol hydroxylase [Paenibacillus polysaccharolyticus]